MKILSHGKRKDLDGSKEDWNEAMSFYNHETRGELANYAAHRYTLIEVQEGDVVCLYYSVDNNDKIEGGIRVWRNDEDQGTSYYEVHADDLKKYIIFLQAMEQRND